MTVPAVQEIERVPLDGWRCPTDGCPWPDDREMHVCWAQGASWHRCSGSVTHQHWPKRSQGGKDIVAILCGPLHDCIDNGLRYQGKRLTNWTEDGIYYIGEREHEGVAIFAKEIPDAGLDSLGGDAGPAAGSGASGIRRGVYQNGTQRDDGDPEDPRGSERDDSGDVHGDSGRSTGLQLLNAASLAAPSPIFNAQGLAPEVRNLTIDQWQAIISYLGAVREGATWAIGDAVNLAESEHGEKYSQALEATKLSYDRLSNIAYTARRFDPSLRRENLSFGVYEALAPLAGRDASQAAEVIEKAAGEGWTREAVEAELEARGERQAKPRKEPETLAAFTVPSLREKFAVWPDRVAYRNNLNKGFAAFMESLK